VIEQQREQQLNERMMRHFSYFGFVVVFAAFFSACSTFDRPVSSPYYAEVVQPPPKKEFRWSNGRLPKSFDPAMATTPPETDAIRAIYEGLTSTDPRTLEAVPAVAEKWTTSDNKVWRFQLSDDAVWSNGKPVTADDFVRSWNRLASLGEKAAHPELLRNFARARPAPLPKPSATPWASDEPPPLIPKPSATVGPLNLSPASALDLKAESAKTLVITLQTSDPDLPKLLANPIFSPVYGDGSEFNSPQPENAIISNGPFRLAMVTKEFVALDRSDSYRARASVEVDTVRLIPADTADEALDAYKSGKVDVVTNADFEPLALKVLSPYQDFRKVTHGALNLYEFNTAKPPFNDRRVREALSIAIERERLTDGELEGSTRPALRFLPIGAKPVKEIVQDIARARELLSAAGFADGQGFPVVKLIINRNDAQQRIARAVARMWKQNLGIDTEIISFELYEMDEVRELREFDLIRRGVVFPSSDPQANLWAIFDPHDAGQNGAAAESTSATANSNIRSRSVEERDSQMNEIALRSPSFASEADAIYEFTAIPLYFPSAYSLVTPYVQGFEPNGLGIHLLQDVRIDNNWQPKRPLSES
jgi:oligopeptide transport system substrate-binding protein